VLYNPTVGKLTLCLCAPPQLQLEYHDNHLLVQFVWLMQKRTLVSVSRFEEIIHTQFAELVSLGYLKLNKA